jgi:hypothetical protein
VLRHVHDEFDLMCAVFQHHSRLTHFFHCLAGLLQTAVAAEVGLIGDDSAICVDGMGVDRFALHFDVHVGDQELRDDDRDLARSLQEEAPVDDFVTRSVGV